MKNKSSLFAFSGGLFLLVVQFLILTFQYVNGDMSGSEQIFFVEQNISFTDYLSQYWSGLSGCLMFLYLYIRRITKGPDVLLMMVGVLLWIIQILGRYESQQILDFILTYLLGIIGIVLVAIVACFDAYAMKNNGSDDK